MKNLLSVIVILISTIGMSNGQTTKEILTSTTERNLKSRLNNPQSYRRGNVEFIEFKRIESLKYDLNLINDVIDGINIQIKNNEELKKNNEELKKNNVEVINQLKTNNYFCNSQIDSLSKLLVLKNDSISQKNSILMDSIKFYDTEVKNINFEINRKTKIKRITKVCLGSAVVATLTGGLSVPLILTLPLGAVVAVAPNNQPESRSVQKMRLNSFDLIYKKLTFEQEIKENNTNNLEYKISGLKNEIKENNNKIDIINTKIKKNNTIIDNLEYEISGLNLVLKDFELKKDSLEYRINKTNKNEVECYIVKIIFRATNKYGGITKQSYEQWFPSSKPINSLSYFCYEEGVFTSDYNCDILLITEHFGYTYSKYIYLRDEMK
jgi:hypothetical protein